MIKKLQAVVMAIWGLVFFLVVDICIFMPLYILGAIAFQFVFLFADIEAGPYSRLYEGKIITRFKNPFFDWWLGNYEDGLAPEWWQRERNGTAYGWYLRNPVTNLRFAKFISTKPDPARVRFVGSDVMTDDGIPCHFLAWQGPFVGYRYQNTKWGVWFGWKVHPEDRFGLKENDYRRHGIGTACQFMRF